MVRSLFLAVKVAYEQHADHQLRLHRGTARVAVLLRQHRPHDGQIEHYVDPPKQVIGRYVPLLIGLQAG